MNRDSILQVLADNREHIARLGVRKLSLFGSFARNEATAESDVDLLVDFGRPARFDGWVQLLELLETIFQRPVDLVTTGGLRPELRPYIEREMIDAPGF